MKKATLFTLLALCGLIVACADKSDDDIAGDPIDRMEEPAAKSNIIQQLKQEKLPENAPEVGTAVTAMINVVKPKEEPTDTPPADPGDITKILWEDLVPDDYRPDIIMKKYQAQIDKIPEGSLEERKLFDKIMAEFNNAPPNDSLTGKRVKIPGFVAPLDENEGMVGEFLLVPYFGSCIHAPPPPINQTVLVQPQHGKSIPMERIYEPVWVTGLMKVELNTTELAQAGYLIENAQLEVYREEKTN